MVIGQPFLRGRDRLFRPARRSSGATSATAATLSCPRGERWKVLVVEGVGAGGDTPGTFEVYRAETGTYILINTQTQAALITYVLPYELWLAPSDAIRTAGTHSAGTITCNADVEIYPISKYGD